ncbi:MAG: HepT-like ribonuclease domain-containing protein [archaeon]
MSNYNLYINLILETIEKIEKSCKEKKQIINNINLQDATLMRLQIIGENIKKIPLELKRKNKEFKWKKFGRLRNLISHRYETINYELIWSFIKTNLPELKKEILRLKNEIK